MKIVVLLWIIIAGDHQDPRSAYIEHFKPLAITEMNRTGIPASIKLAQAIHESNAGQSKLSTRSNNHFGIKCKSYWQGATYYHIDDDYDDRGVLIKSCFRSYDAPIDSYIDHSNFITESTQYGHLVQTCGKDYKKWAHSLQILGYASDAHYADKLINIVESYQLDLLDDY